VRLSAFLGFALPVLVLPLLPVPEFWITLANYIGLYSIVAIGLVVLTGVGGMTSFGQAAFVGLGAYAAAYLGVVHGQPAWVTLLAGVAITATAAYVIGLLTMRLAGHYLPLGTLAWGLALFYLFGNLQMLGAHDGIRGIEPIRFLGIVLDNGRSTFYLIFVCLFAAIAASANLLDSRIGRAISALKGGAVMAEAMGVDTGKAKTVAFVYAAILAAVSGWLYAYLQRAVNPTPVGLNMGIEYLFMVIIGGAGHIWGAVLGAALMTLLKDQLQSLLPRLLGNDGNYEMVVLGILLVLMMQFARQGIWPALAARFAAFRPRPVGEGTAAGASAPAAGAGLPRREALPAGATLLAVTRRFGGLVAVNDMRFTVGRGEIVGLIGPNGAGKSTMFNLVTGLLEPTSGDIRFAGRSIVGRRSRDIARAGIGRTFQHVRLLPDKSVLDNTAIGAHWRSSAGVLRSMLKLNRGEEAAIRREAAWQLERVGLGDLLDREAGSLSLGQQRMVEIARALCTDPVLLMLDEPAAGLRHMEKRALGALLRKVREQGVSILIVEHDMEFVMSLTDRIVVMEFGSKICEGTPRQVQSDPRVLEAYLGGVDD
jgi:ABC-type branched-subunit amino acid transport system ATPase component/ABC-type branched-subunit amino acid transport system permease subunit